MSQTLNNLVQVSGTGSNGKLKLESGAQNVIVTHLTHASLKTNTILTSFASTFAFLATVLSERPDFSNMGLLLLLLFLFGMALLIWVLPRRVGYFDDKSWLGIEYGTLATLLFCLYDVALALTVVFVHLQRSGPPEPLT